MSSRSVTPETPIPADRLAEAGVWIARLHGDGRDRELELGFNRWLKANPLNARAFELATEVWDDSQNLLRVVQSAHELPVGRHSAPRFRAIALTAGAAVAFTVAIVVMFLHYRQAPVTTGVGEQRQLALEDGSRVILNTATSLVVHYDKAARRIDLESGEAFFDVAKRPDWPFIVVAGGRQVTALGTSFVVRYDHDLTAVTLVEGRVTVTPVGEGVSGSALAGPSAATTSTQVAAKHPPTVALAPGQRLTFSRNQADAVDAPSIDEAIAWRRGQVVLDDTPLPKAIVEMNRYSSTTLVIGSPEAASLRVSGLFQTGDSESFAKVVAQAYGLQVAQRPGEIVLEGRPHPTARGGDSPP